MNPLGIRLNFVKQGEQRYPTVGDWQFHDDHGPNNEGDLLVVTITDTGNEKANLALALHEIVEALLCRWNGVSQEWVDEFDLKFTADPKNKNKEPGEDFACPYYNDHGAATDIEYEFLRALRLPLDEYYDLVDAVAD